MTCIVGLIDSGGRAWMGGDRRAMTSNEVIVERGTPKIMRRNGILSGTCGLASVGRILQELDWPGWPQGLGLDDWAWRCLIPLLRPAVRDFGEMEEHNGAQVVSAAALLAGRGQIVYLGSMSSAILHAKPYFAIGSGCDYALGVLHVTAIGDKNPGARLRWALEAAAAFDPGVAPPFDIINDFEDA